MTDTIFDTFIESVYGGGSTMELFDSIDIVGGVDDISVESIFGGSHVSNHAVDESSDDSSDESSDESNDESAHESTDAPDESFVSPTNLKINFSDVEEDTSPSLVGSISISVGQDTKQKNKFTPEEIAEMLSDYE